MVSRPPDWRVHLVLAAPSPNGLVIKIDVVLLAGRRGREQEKHREQKTNNEFATA